MDASKIAISPALLKLISEVDEFKGKWGALKSIAPEHLLSLKTVATIESVGSSTRIEGARLSDREVRELLSGLKIRSFQSRDEEEVAGYAECMEMILEGFDDISFDENHALHLHQVLLKYSTKDERHRGHYKKLPNHVEAFDPDGNRLGIVFETAAPFDTPRLMRELYGWLTEEGRKGELHPLIRLGVFVITFLAIHPFQDGNGRLSRILTGLYLLQSGYSFVPYSSLERVIELKKKQYYLALREAQQTLYTDNSSLEVWLLFFVGSIREQVADLERKLAEQEDLTALPGVSEKIMTLARDLGRVTIKVAAQNTGISRNTIKAHVRKLVSRGLLRQEGRGRGTWYRPG
jgi:Fic family protein